MTLIGSKSFRRNLMATFAYVLLIPLEHFREEEFSEAGVGFRLGHEVEKFVGVA
jgi:hypothetical protein